MQRVYRAGRDYNRCMLQRADSSCRTIAGVRTRARRAHAMRNRSPLRRARGRAGGTGRAARGGRARSAGSHRGAGQVLGASRGNGAARVCRQHARARRAGRRGRGVRRHGDRAGSSRNRRFPGRALLRVGAAAAARDAGVRDGIRVHRFPPVRGAGAERRCATRSAGRRATTGFPTCARCGGAAAMFVFSRCTRTCILLARTAFLERPRVADRGRAHAGPRRATRVLARRPAARASRRSPAASRWR